MKKKISKKVYSGFPKKIKFFNPKTFKDLEVFLNEINLMSEFNKDNKFKLSIKINLDDLTDANIDLIESIFVNNKGGHDLEILLAGPDNINIKAISKIKIDIKNDILKKLDELSFNYFLN